MTRKKIGRMQYFYHSPSSNLPIRDVLNERKEGYKTEPHIEINAENYLKKCVPQNIARMKNNNEKYLFLVTSCQSKKFDVYKKKAVVGYMKNVHFEESTHLYAIGPTKLFSFEDALTLTQLGYSNSVRMLTFDEERTDKIIQHFKNKKNIITECLEEIIKLDINNNTCFHLSEKDYFCSHSTQCKRTNMAL